MRPSTISDSRVVGILFDLCILGSFLGTGLVIWDYITAGLAMDMT